MAELRSVKSNGEGVLGEGTGGQRHGKRAPLSANVGGAVGWQAVWDRQCDQMREGPKGLEPGGEEMPSCEHCLGDTWGQKEMGSGEDERRMKTSRYVLA